MKALILTLITPSLLLIGCASSSKVTQMAQEIDSLQSNLASLSEIDHQLAEEIYAPQGKYMVWNGDSWFKIATKYQTTPTELRRLNPEFAPSWNLPVGTIIRVKETTSK